MSSLLARLGRASYRHRGLVTVAWLALLGAVVALLVTVGGSFDDRFTIRAPSRRPPSTSWMRPPRPRPA